MAAGIGPAQAPIQLLRHSRARYTPSAMRNRVSLSARGALRFPAVALSLALLGGCALQRYDPAPLDPAASASAFGSRSTDAPGLKDYLVAHGHPPSDWPVQHWGLAELTLLAFYDHPDLELARARAKAAHADASAAMQRAPFGLTPRVQHHTVTTPEQPSVWSLGFEVEIPVAGSTRRAATSERFAYLADAADLQVGSVAWSVRSEVRAKLLDCYAVRPLGLAARCGDRAAPASGRSAGAPARGWCRVARRGEQRPSRAGRDRGTDPGGATCS